MDLSNYKSNSFYDSLINQIVNNQLNYDQAIKNILNNEFINEFTIGNQSNENFINYFINSLHLSCQWIINNNSNQIRSIQNTPAKIVNKLVPVQLTINKSKNDKLTSINEVKRNLFDSKNDQQLDSRLKPKFKSPKLESKLDHSRFSSPKIDLTKFESRFDSSKQHKQNEVNVEKLNLNDEESFPKLDNHTFIKTPSSSERKSSDQKSSKKQRRINPTQVKDNEKILTKTLFGKNAKVFCEAPELDQKDLQSTRDEIKLMAKDFSMITPKKNITTTSTCTQLMIRTPIKNQEPFIQPSLDKIDFVDSDNLIKFYSNLIEKNLIPNVLAELDFLIQLITRRCTSETTSEFLAPFEFCSNYHNCILFAVKSLEHLYTDTLINYFDEQFFKMLSLNEAIKRMSKPEFQNFCKRSDLLNDEDELNDLDMTIAPALDFFDSQPETDSQENFSNENTSHWFRKQRDAFCKLYDEYETLSKECFKPESIIQNPEFKFVPKVTHMLRLSKDFANYSHLAKLFLAKLMQCCTGNEMVNNEQIKKEAIKDQNTPNVFHEKIKKLNQRFNQQDQKIMATQSSFIGKEIFFYEFIVACNNYSFLTILQSLLVSKIIELNSPYELIERIELDEKNLEIASYFSINLLNLQLLAKFLGLIVFMPFYSKQINSSISTKNSFNETFKNIHPQETGICKMITQMIFDSLKRKHLISTIPWIIQFLNQMDSNTITLTNYVPTFNILIDIYHELGLKRSQYPMHKMNYSYLKLVFGNFFEKYFFIYHSKLNEISNTELLIKFDYSDKTLDSFQLINKKFLIDCFPKLFVIKELVKQGTTTQSNEIRKIKPLSLNLNESFTMSTTPAKIDKKNLVQIEYEENFLRLHPDSLRKTVEFVADRLHSKCIKRLRIDVIKKVKRETFAKHADLSKTKTILDEIRDQCLKFIRQFVDENVDKTVDLLISEHDFSQNVVKIAKSITLRMLMDKCLNWMSNNVNDSWIINEILVENSRRQQQQIKSTNQDTSIDQFILPNISNCFNRIRDHICDLLFKNEFNCTKEELNNLIDELTKFRNPNSHLNARTNQVIETTIMDLIITLVTYQPKQVDSDLIIKFVNFYVENKLTVTRFISARNFFMLCQSKQNSYDTWNKFESILLRFLQKDIYLIKTIEDDLIAVTGKENDWEEKPLKKLASCIKSVVDYCKSHEKYRHDANEVELVDWLSWFCAQSSDIDY